MQKPTQQSKYIGVDVAKKELLACLGNKTRSFANTPEQCAALLKAAGTHAHVVCEATGGYERHLVEAAHAAGNPVSVVMPKRVRYYAYAAGLLAKNDTIDAGLISRYADAMKPAAQPKPDACQVELRELMRVRDTLVGQINRHASRNEHPPRLALVIEQARGRAAMLEAHLKQIEQAIKTLIESNDTLREKAAAIQRIRGVGKVSAHIILAEMPQLGSLEQGQPASALGVAPHPCESGGHKGRRRTAEGNPRVRNVLYMAAVSASQHNHILKVVYARLIASGKPPQVALTAIMRKLIELINHVLKYPDFVLAS